MGDLVRLSVLYVQPWLSVTRNFEFSQFGQRKSRAIVAASVPQIDCHVHFDSVTIAMDTSRGVIFLASASYLPPVRYISANMSYMPQ